MDCLPCQDLAAAKSKASNLLRAERMKGSPADRPPLATPSESQLYTLPAAPETSNPVSRSSDADKAGPDTLRCSLPLAARLRESWVSPQMHTGLCGKTFKQHDPCSSQAARLLAKFKQRLLLPLTAQHSDSLRWQHVKASENERP